MNEAFVYVDPWADKHKEEEVPVDPAIAAKNEEIRKLTQEVQRLSQGGLSVLDVGRKASAVIDAVDKRLEKGDGYDQVEAIALEAKKLETQEVARKLYDASKVQSGYKTLDIQPLATLLEEDDLPLEWRINGLMQKGHNITLAARYKVGKTTFVANLLKSLVDGTPFLGEYAVMQVTKPVVVFNHELSDRQFTAWLRKTNIKNTHMIIPVNLRGKGLYLQDEDAQDWAIELLKEYETEVWIIDPLQAALRGTVNDDNVASDWIAAADKVKAEAGVSELLLVTHTGHLSKADEYGRSTNERSAGSSRWAGWPDALWTYTKDEEGTRYLSAEGRDVSVEEFGISWDEETMILTSKGEGTGRINAKEARPFLKLVELFRDNPDAVLTRPDMERELRISNKLLTTAIRDAEGASMIKLCELPKVAGSRGRTPSAYCLTGQGKWSLKRANK